jgi:hypothetical protein
MPIPAGRPAVRGAYMKNLFAEFERQCPGLLASLDESARTAGSG